MMNQHYFPRPTYLATLANAEFTRDFVRIITGVRRSGKSVLLELYRQQLIESGVEERKIISINFEEMTNDHLRDAQTFHDYVSAQIETNQAEYLHVDEVQELHQWARVINSLRTGHNIEICVTGSNASIFATEDIRYLSGRYITIEVFPLSLKELRDFGNTQLSTQETFRRMLTMGTFPAVAQVSQTQSALTINRGLFDSIFTRDVLSVAQIRDPEVFYRVARFVFDTSGSPASLTKIARTLTSAGFKTNHVTVEKYLTLMVNAHLVYKCPTRDAHGKDFLIGQEKYYWVDPGLRNGLLGPRSDQLSGIGHDLENLVYLELKRRGYEIASVVGAKSGLKIDFYATRGEESHFIQVAWETSRIDTLERELKAFTLAPAGAHCILMSADMFPPKTGHVQYMPALDFLAGSAL